MQNKIIRLLLLLLCFPTLLYSSNKKSMEDTAKVRIDTHIHLYDTRREGSAVFLDPEANHEIYFPHFGDTFADTANPAGVQYAVVVEASMRREDNYWLKNLVDTSSNLPAFIANLDPRNPYYSLDLDSLSKSPKFRGIRIRPSSPINISDYEVITGFAGLARRGLILELGGNGVDPAVVADIAARFPNMNIIMNHLAGGRLAGGTIKPADWKSRLAVFAREPNVYCKVSALYTLSGQNPAPVDAEYYKQLIDPVVEAFGTERILFGSNWTLSDMYGSYTDLVKMLDDYLLERPDIKANDFYYNNACKAYGINQNKPEHNGDGSGLSQSFWNGKPGGRGWFEDSVMSQTSIEINEYWNEDAPMAGVEDMFWNCRWEGYIEPMYSGTHRIFLTINDMAKLWINDQLMIDAWTSLSTNSAFKCNIDLLKGERVPVQIDYANLTGDGYIKLEWEADSVPREVIPVNQLYLPENTLTRKNKYDDKCLIYPNPASQFVNFEISGPGNYEVQICDLSGSEVMKKKNVKNKKKLDISFLSRGIYLIKLSGLNSQQTRKLIVY